MRVYYSIPRNTLEYYYNVRIVFIRAVVSCCITRSEFRELLMNTVYQAPSWKYADPLTPCKHYIKILLKIKMRCWVQSHVLLYALSEKKKSNPCPPFDPKIERYHCAYIPSCVFTRDKVSRRRTSLPLCTTVTVKEWEFPPYWHKMKHDVSLDHYYHSAKIPAFTARALSAMSASPYGGKHYK